MHGFAIYHIVLWMKWTILIKLSWHIIDFICIVKFLCCIHASIVLNLGFKFHRICSCETISLIKTISQQYIHWDRYLAITFMQISKDVSIFTCKSLFTWQTVQTSVKCENETRKWNAFIAVFKCQTQSASTPRICFRTIWWECLLTVRVGGNYHDQSMVTCVRLFNLVLRFVYM